MLGRNSLLLDIAVPVDWPKKPGYPPKGPAAPIRLRGYPAGQGMGIRGPGHDMEYPLSMKKIAQAHSWEFPSKRIKLGRTVLVASLDEIIDYTRQLQRRYDVYKRRAEVMGAGHPKTVRALDKAGRALTVAAADVPGPPRVHPSIVKNYMQKIVGAQVKADVERARGLSAALPRRRRTGASEAPTQRLRRTTMILSPQEIIPSRRRAPIRRETERLIRTEGLERTPLLLL